MIPTGLLPEGTKWCIAGGYAACPALASDIDVWVYGVPRDNLQVHRAELLLHLAKRDFHVATEAGDNLQNEEYETDGQVSILKVARIGIGRGNGNMPVHVMVTDARTVHDVLGHFDVSTHAVAIDYNGSVIKHKRWTPPQDPPVALMNHTTTYDRVERITERFRPTNQPQETPF